MQSPPDFGRRSRRALCESRGLFFWHGTQRIHLAAAILVITTALGLTLERTRILRAQLGRPRCLYPAPASLSRNGSLFNSRRSTPITISSAVAVDVPADAQKHDSI